MQNEKPWWQSWKVIVSMLVTVMLFGVILTLAIMGKVAVTSEQIINFGEWLLAFLLGGHAVQSVGASIGNGIANRSTQSASPLIPPGAVETSAMTPVAEGDEDAE
jgi:ABC-type multidrug transport system permease subunit